MFIVTEYAALIDQYTIEKRYENSESVTFNRCSVRFIQ